MKLMTLPGYKPGVLLQLIRAWGIYRSLCGDITPIVTLGMTFY